MMFETTRITITTKSTRGSFGAFVIFVDSNG